ncbi:hypothetical protein [Sphaerisporangium dianthi]|uniref:Uncharacterized protein n=1 Tax=Sphaerisporangium dianthi TaxID=1436120 RepID=A0ABV9CRU6_9ACTN
MTGSPSSPETDMFAEPARMPADDDREVYLWRHPWLLEPGVGERAAGHVAAAPQAERPAMSVALAHLMDVRRRYEVGDAGYPIGMGPIESVWQQVGVGQISVEEGERLVRAPAFTAALSARYLHANRPHPRRRLLQRVTVYRLMAQG